MNYRRVASLYDGMERPVLLRVTSECDFGFIVRWPAGKEVTGRYRIRRAPISVVASGFALRVLWATVFSFPAARPWRRVGPFGATVLLSQSFDNFSITPSGNSCANTKNAAFVHPNPTIFTLYPAVTAVSDDFVTALYFSRIVPSRRKFSCTFDKNASETRSATSLNPYRRIPSSAIN